MESWIVSALTRAIIPDFYQICQGFISAMFRTSLKISADETFLQELCPLEILLEKAMHILSCLYFCKIFIKVFKKKIEGLFKLLPLDW